MEGCDFVNKIEVYATITPINFVMDVPSRTRSKSEADLDLDRLYFEAVNYGNNGKRGVSLQKGEKGESIKTTLATSRIEVHPSNLVGFKAKVLLLPDAFEKALLRDGKTGVLTVGGRDTQVVGGVVAAERAISTFKQFAARRLQRALDEGVRGYDNCVAVINEINARSVLGVCKIEFFVKRVNAQPFHGAGMSKRDGLWYRTDKVRKFYCSTKPSVELLESIIRTSLLSDKVVAYNNDFVFRKVDKRNVGSEVGEFSIQLTRVGYEDPRNSDDDRQVGRLLQQMRRPKRE